MFGQTPQDQKSTTKDTKAPCGRRKHTKVA